MKLAPWVALGAVAAFVAAVAWAEKPPMPGTVLPLDFSGIDTLVVETQSAKIELDQAATHEIHLDYGESASVERRGATLRIRGKGSYQDIRAPVTLRRIVLEGGGIQAGQGVGELDVETTGTLSWRGDARVLRIVNHLQQPRCDDWCNSVEINQGNIGTLFVRLHGGRVALNKAGAIDRVVLALGADAQYELEGLRGAPPPVIVIGEHDEPPAPLSTRAVSVPAEPAARPPRQP
jgi:hypothetical protein